MAGRLVLQAISDNSPDRVVMRKAVMLLPVLHLLELFIVELGRLFYSKFPSISSNVRTLGVRLKSFQRFPQDGRRQFLEKSFDFHVDVFVESVPSNDIASQRSA